MFFHFVINRSNDNPLTDPIVDSVETKVEDTSGNQNKPPALKTHRDGVRMTKTALRRETFIKNAQNLLKLKTGSMNQKNM